jgi:hypothetical protein
MEIVKKIALAFIVAAVLLFGVRMITRDDSSSSNTSNDTSTTTSEEEDNGYHQVGDTASLYYKNNKKMEFDCTLNEWGKGTDTDGKSLIYANFTIKATGTEAVSFTDDYFTFYGDDEQLNTEELSNWGIEVSNLSKGRKATGMAACLGDADDYDNIEVEIGDAKFALKGENVLQRGLDAQSKADSKDIKVQTKDSDTSTDSTDTDESTTDEDDYSTSDDYILPDSSSRIYSDDELSTLSSGELRIAKNEIYARHGRRFKDESLQSYFDSKSWYNGTIEPDDFDEGVLNKYEKANIESIAALE